MSELQTYLAHRTGRKRRIGGWILVGFGLFFGVLFPVIGTFTGGIGNATRALPQVPVRVIDMSEGRPTFEIVNGEFAGRKAASIAASQPPAHFVGDEVQGYFDESDGSIETDATIGTMELIGTIFFWVGLAIGGTLLVVGLILVLLGRRAKSRAVAAVGAT